MTINQIQENSTEQSQQTGEGQPQVQFKQVETRLLGPLSLLVQSNTEDGTPAKGLDLILPAFTWALEVRLFLPVPQELLLPKATESYRRVDNDVEMLISCPPNMRLSIRFPDSFYEKYGDHIENKSNYKIMAYVLGYLDRTPFTPQQAALASQQRQAQEQAQGQDSQQIDDQSNENNQ
ncbi:MAG: hypothetical protein ACK481_05235 [Candidatus Melainabacteria bacterium]